jgi:hypothetical protein
LLIYLNFLRDYIILFLQHIFVYYYERERERDRMPYYLSSQQSINYLYLQYAYDLRLIYNIITKYNDFPKINERNVWVVLLCTEQQKQNKLLLHFIHTKNNIFFFNVNR